LPAGAYLPAKTSDGERCQRPLFISQIFAAFDCRERGAGGIGFRHNDTSSRRLPLFDWVGRIVYKIKRVPHRRLIGGHIRADRNKEETVYVVILVSRDSGPPRRAHAHGLRESRISDDETANLKREILRSLFGCGLVHIQTVGIEAEIAAGFAVIDGVDFEDGKDFVGIRLLFRAG